MNSVSKRKREIGRGKESAATQIWQIFRMYRTRIILAIWNGVNACKYAAPSSTCLRLFHNLASNVNVSMYVHSSRVVEYACEKYIVQPRSKTKNVYHNYTFRIHNVQQRGALSLLFFSLSIFSLYALCPAIFILLRFFRLLLLVHFTSSSFIWLISFIYTIYFFFWCRIFFTSSSFMYNVHVGMLCCNFISLCLQVGGRKRRTHNSDEMKREIPNMLVRWKECWFVLLLF